MSTGAPELVAFLRAMEQFIEKLDAVTVSDEDGRKIEDGLDASALQAETQALMDTAAGLLLARVPIPADVLVAIKKAMNVVGWPADRWNSQQAQRPGGPHRRWQGGDVVSAIDLSRLDSARKLVRGVVAPVPPDPVFFSENGFRRLADQVEDAAYRDSWRLESGGLMPYVAAAYRWIVRVRPELAPLVDGLRVVSEQAGEVAAARIVRDLRLVADQLAHTNDGQSANGELKLPATAADVVDQCITCTEAARRWQASASWWRGECAAGLVTATRGRSNAYLMRESDAEEHAKKNGIQPKK